MTLRWGVDTRMLPGQTSSGDHYLVRATPEGTLIAVIDGLGHGQEAAAAALAAVSVLEQNAALNVIALVRHCHERLRPMRGVVMSLASFNLRDGLLSWIGVGNVAGILLRSSGEPRRETLLLRGGVVGAQLPPLQAAILPVAPGDTLIFATDGIRNSFVNDLPSGVPPKALAEWILTRYANGADEALALGGSI